MKVGYGRTSTLEQVAALKGRSRPSRRQDARRRPRAGGHGVSPERGSLVLLTPETRP
jgi:hypothetical protein